MRRLRAVSFEHSEGITAPAISLNDENYIVKACSLILVYQATLGNLT